jgi:hypothetical protein
MVSVLDNRITEPLAFTVVRQRIVDILEDELENQIALAEAEEPPADTTPYEITIFQEKTNPWQLGQFPCANVWYDTAAIDTSVAPPTANQQGEHFYNIDVYDSHPSELDPQHAVIFGDYLIQIAVQNYAAVLYQILMADINTKLQFPSRQAGTPIAFFSHRQIVEMVTYKQTFGDHPVDNVAAFRLRLKTVHTELIPKIEGLPLLGFDFILSRRDSTIETDIPIEMNT